MEAYTVILKSFVEGNSLIMQWAKAKAEQDWETLAFLAKNWDGLVEMIGVYENVNMMI